MRIKYLLFYLCCITIFKSCSKKASNNYVDEFHQIENELIEKFGHESYFTDLKITQNTEETLELNILVTNKPYAYKMDGWTYKNGKWKKITEVDLELPQGDILNYLYTIGKEVDIVKVGYLMDLCILKAKEKGYNNVVINNVSVISPNDGDKSKMGYTITLFSNNDTTICYTYNLQGDLTKEYIL